MPNKELVQKSIELASKAIIRAYTPYSNFHVSACLYLPKEQEIIQGVNVENLSFGATICAERSAISSAISKYGLTDFGFLLVYTHAKELTPPCGMCRQVIAEFCNADFSIILANRQGDCAEMSLSSIFPKPFASIEV